MSYSDFLTAVAKDNGIASAAELVSRHGDKYLHLIKSRDRARELLGQYRGLLELSFKDQRILDLGSGVGSVAIELFHQGAEVTAIEPSARWLGMAEEHARNEAQVAFVKADLLHGMADLPAASFDVVFAIDTLPRIYDLYHAVLDLRRLLKPGGWLAFRIPSGTGPTVMDDKRGLGLPLVAPDYWSEFTQGGVGQYHRPWGFYHALLREAGFAEPRLAVPMADELLERARYKLRSHLTRLKKKLKEREGLENPKAYILARNVLKPYIHTAEQDLQTLSWEALNMTYRAPVWSGVARAN